MALHCQYDAPLGELNTFGVQALAHRLWRLDSAADIPGLVARLRDDDQGTPLVIGGGSNLLITGDIQAPVVSMALRGRRFIRERGDRVIVEAAAGEPWDALVHWTLNSGFFGLENLALIPGTVGAAPIQNIGAYGVELREVFDSLDAVHMQTGRLRRFDAQDCAFGYRDSVFKQAAGQHWMVCAVRLALSRNPRLQLDYGDIRDALAQAGVVAPTPHAVAQAVSSIRRRKLPDPAVLGNAGSFFKNPLIDPTQARKLREHEPQIPLWPSAEQIKVSAAWMIERCGWKGHRQGDAGVHAAHALVLVNHGQASGADLLALASRIRDSVRERFGVTLEPEPRVVGGATL